MNEAECNASGFSVNLATPGVEFAWSMVGRDHRQKPPSNAARSGAVEVAAAADVAGPGRVGNVDRSGAGDWPRTTRDDLDCPRPWRAGVVPGRRVGRAAVRALRCRQSAAADRDLDPVGGHAAGRLPRVRVPGQPRRGRHCRPSGGRRSDGFGGGRARGRGCRVSAVSAAPRGR